MLVGKYVGKISQIQQYSTEGSIIDSKIMKFHPLTKSREQSPS